MEGRSKKVFPKETTSTASTNSKAGNNSAVRSTNARDPRASYRPATIRNPYATTSGRTSIGTYKANNNNNNGSSSTAATKLASETAARMPAVAASTGLSGKNHKPRQKQKQKQQSKDSEYWERLPSRNISFSPAEVLTVSECLKEDQSIARLYCQGQKSVRITGRLIDRSMFCFGGDWIEMKVGDPTATTTAAMAETVRQKLGAAAFSKRKARLSLPPSSSSSLSRQDKTRQKSRKRPWFVSSNSNSSSSSSKAIPGSSKPAVQSKEHTTLEVMVDLRGVAGSVLQKAVVGSFVTVIGEFVRAKDKGNGDDEGEHPVRYSLEARTLAVGRPGTNMLLYQKALITRRKTIYERYYYDNNPSVSPNTLLLQGCGPPPYDVFHRELSGPAGRPFERITVT